MRYRMISELLNVLNLIQAFATQGLASKGRILYAAECFDRGFIK